MVLCILKSYMQPVLSLDKWKCILIKIKDNLEEFTLITIKDEPENIHLDEDNR